MEFERLLHDANSRGLDTRYCQDISTLVFLHRLADSKGIPRRYEDDRMRCKLTGYLLEGNDLATAKEYVADESRNQRRQTSCFPRLLFRLEDTKPTSVVHSREFYETFPRNILRYWTMMRYPMYREGDDYITCLQIADAEGVPDASSLQDAKSRYDVSGIIMAWYNNSSLDVHNVFPGTVENDYIVPTYYREGDEYILSE